MFAVLCGKNVYLLHFHSNVAKNSAVSSRETSVSPSHEHTHPTQPADLRFLISKWQHTLIFYVWYSVTRKRVDKNSVKYPFAKCWCSVSLNFAYALFHSHYGFYWNWKLKFIIILLVVKSEAETHAMRCDTVPRTEKRRTQRDFYRNEFCTRNKLNVTKRSHSSLFHFDN